MFSGTSAGKQTCDPRKCICVLDAGKQLCPLSGENWAILLNFWSQLLQSATLPAATHPENPASMVLFLGRAFPDSPTLRCSCHRPLPLLPVPPGLP